MAEEMLFCDVCGEPIFDGQDYYELPGGLIVCCDSDCLEEWAGDYLRCAQ